MGSISAVHAKWNRVARERPRNRKRPPKSAGTRRKVPAEITNRILGVQSGFKLEIPSAAGIVVKQEVPPGAAMPATGISVVL
jgi:hypothetical protein